MQENYKSAALQSPVSLHYRVVGESGDWVLLLHGLFGAGDNLGVLAKALMAEFRVVQVDLRNHGHSPHTDMMTFETMAADIALLQDSLGIESSYVVGHSLGGRVAMQLALQYPERVERLVVADIAPVDYAPHHVGIMAALQSVDLRGIASRGEVDTQLATWIADTGTRQFLLKSLYKDGDAWRWRFNLPALQASYANITVAQHGEPFTKPVLFIRGGNSDYILPEHEAAMRVLFPRFELESIAGAGHWLHGEKPAEFNRLALDFLRR